MLQSFVFFIFIKFSFDNTCIQKHLQLAFCNKQRDIILLGNSVLNFSLQN